LPFPDARFDLVISTDVIEHIADDAAALCEMARVLAPAGRLLVTTPAYSWAYSNHDRCLHHVRRYDRRRLREAFGKARLQLIHSARYNVVLAAPVLLARLVRGHGGDSDVARPIPRLMAPALDLCWHIEASLAERLDLCAGLTHVAVLAHAES
jgi:SAM-dependent methyltransferase